MTDKEIVKRAKDAEKRTRFGELVHSSVANGVNSAYGIGFIEGMVEYRKSLQEEPVSKDLEKAAVEAFKHIVDSDKNNFLEIFKAGAEWKEKQMMKDAIDTELDDVCGFLTISIPYHNGIAGDKVKVVIIKSE